MPKLPLAALLFALLAFAPLAAQEHPAFLLTIFLRHDQTRSLDERKAMLGGKARSIAVPDSGVNGRQPLPGRRVDARDLECDARVQWRQQTGQPTGEHRLARARRTDEQEVMSACCGNLERAAREQLTAHVRQVGHI